MKDTNYRQPFALRLHAECRKCIPVQVLNPCITAADFVNYAHSKPVPAGNSRLMTSRAELWCSFLYIDSRPSCTTSSYLLLLFLLLPQQVSSLVLLRVCCQCAACVWLWETQSHCQSSPPKPVFPRWGSTSCCQQLFFVYPSTHAQVAAVVALSMLMLVWL